MKEVIQGLLPLFAQVGWADHQDAASQPARHQFADHQASFNGLAKSDIVCNQHPHRLLAKRHDERNQLVSNRDCGSAAERAWEQCCAASKAEGTQHQFQRLRSANDIRVWHGKLPWLYGFQRQVKPGLQVGFVQGR